MKTKHVIVEDYNPNWISEFQKIKSELLKILNHKIIDIHHIGSTSVPQLFSKPIIDIDIEINNNFNEVKSLLESIGYIHEGNLGIDGREAFKYTNKAHLMKHHLYVLNKDSKELKRHLTFRDYLKNHIDDVKKYGALKKELAEKYPYDIDAYIKGKSHFIENIYKKCGLYEI